MYRWAVSDVQREVAQNYPFVRSIQNYQSQKYLEYVSQLSYEERLNLAVCLVNSVHPIAVRHFGKSVTESDQKALLQYRSFATTSYPEYLNLLRRRNCDACVSIDKGSFFQRITKELELLFACSIKKTGRFSCSITVPVGSWYLKTTVELLSKTEGWPRYYQYILKKPEEIVSLSQLPSHKVTNMFFWMGIHGETVWETPFEIDTEPALKSLLAVCQHLASSLPDTLGGLEPSSFDIRSKVAEWKNMTTL